MFYTVHPSMPLYAKYIELQFSCQKHRKPEIVKTRQR